MSKFKKYIIIEIIGSCLLVVFLFILKFTLKPTYTHQKVLTYLEQQKAWINKEPEMPPLINDLHDKLISFEGSKFIQFNGFKINQRKLADYSEKYNYQIQDIKVEEAAIFFQSNKKDILLFLEQHKDLYEKVTA